MLKSLSAMIVLLLSAPELSALDERDRAREERQNKQHDEMIRAILSRGFQPTRRIACPNSANHRQRWRRENT